MPTDPDPREEYSITSAPSYERADPGGSGAAQRYHEPSPRRASPEASAAALADLRRQVDELSRQLAEERLLNQKLLAVNGYNRGQENAPGMEQSAQMMARALSRLINAQVTCIFSCSSVEKRLKLLAAEGPAASLIPGSFQPSPSMATLQHAVEKLAITSSLEIPGCQDQLQLGSQRLGSLIIVPVARHGALRGVILLAGDASLAFTRSEREILAAAASQLLAAWEYAHQNEVLTEFVQTVTMMSVVQEIGSLAEMIASIARRTLGSSFALVATRSPQQEWVVRGSGKAPRIVQSFQNGAMTFLEEAIKSPYTFRLRDLRSDARARCIQLDSPELCSLLASPIRINGSTSGVLLAFGKTGASSFNEGDVFLAELLSAHAAVNLESCYLNQELRANLKTTELLYDLSLSITQAANLTVAARLIGRAAFRLVQARRCGLVLYSADGQIDAEVHFPSDDPEIVHPYRLIQQAMQSRQTIYLGQNNNRALSAIPIQTQRRCYGALWLEVDDNNEEESYPSDEIRILVSQAAVALERSILLEETRQQAEKIDKAYQDLKTSYDDLLYGLTRALDARDGETERHSVRVEELSVRLGNEMGLSRDELRALKRGALLHDIGKIGVPDMILRKTGPLTEEDWLEMRKHPMKGVEIIDTIPALRDALPVIRYHQERWDGSGYPEKLSGTQIPLLARIFAVTDVYDALTSDRPYRKAISSADALAYLAKQAGIQFDPDIVRIFIRIIQAEQKGLDPSEEQNI